MFCLSIGFFGLMTTQNVKVMVRDAHTGELIKGVKVTQITTYPPTEFWGEGRREKKDLVEDGNQMFHNRMIFNYTANTDRRFKKHAQKVGILLIIH